MNWSPSSWWTLGTRRVVTSVTVDFRGWGMQSVICTCFLVLITSADKNLAEKGREEMG